MHQGMLVLLLVLQHIFFWLYTRFHNGKMCKNSLLLFPKSCWYFLVFICSSVDVRTPDVNSETRVAIHQQNYLTPKKYEVLQMFICFVPDIRIQDVQAVASVKMHQQLYFISL